MWHINLVLNMLQEKNLFSEEELADLKSRLILIDHNLQQFSQDHGDKKIDLGVFSYLFDYVERRLNTESTAYQKIPIERRIKKFLEMYTVSFIVGEKYSKDQSIFLMNIVDRVKYPDVYDLLSKDYQGKSRNIRNHFLLLERIHLKALNYQTAIAPDRIGKFLDYITNDIDNDIDKEEFIKELILASNNNYLDLNLIKEKAQIKFPNLLFISDTSSHEQPKFLANNIEEIVTVKSHDPKYQNLSLNDIYQAVDALKVNFQEITCQLSSYETHLKNENKKLVREDPHGYAPKSVVLKNKINAIKEIQNAIEILQNLQSPEKRSKLTNDAQDLIYVQSQYDGLIRILNGLPRHKNSLLKRRNTGLTHLFWRCIDFFLPNSNKSTMGIKGAKIANSIFTQFNILNENINQEKHAKQKTGKEVDKKWKAP